MSKAPLTPEQRVLRAKIAAHTRWARADPIAATADARAKSPSADAYWLDKVDPDRVLTNDERARRAESAKKAHFAELAFRSSRARQRKAS